MIRKIIKFSPIAVLILLTLIFGLMGYQISQEAIGYLLGVQFMFIMLPELARSVFGSDDTEEPDPTNK